MKILFISPSYKPAYIYGGPAVSVSELAEALASAGHTVTVYTTTANGREELRVPTGVPVKINNVTVYYFKRQTGDHTHISIGLWKKLWSTIKSFNTIHVHSWWSLLILGTAIICRLRKRSFIISPRGMLSTYSFEKQHSWQKKIIHLTLGLPLLKRSHLHATSLLEWNDCRRVNKSWNGFVLPNLVRFSRPLNSAAPLITNDHLTFGYLSRIDQKKGLELLFQALATVDFDFRLRIAGAGEEDYINYLKEQAVKLAIGHKIEWCGWKDGEEKFVFLRSIDVFVLTSYNENFANTVIEALVTGVPVFVSEGVGLAEYVKQSGLGWVCETNVESIAKSLQQIFLEQQQIADIRAIAPERIRKDFDASLLAEKYSDRYRQFA